MNIETSLDRIKEIKSERFQTITPEPETFKDDRLKLKKDKSYSIINDSIINGISSFENKPIQIQLSSPSSEIPTFGFQNKKLPLIPSLTIKGQHNIQLGEIKIIEHPISVMTALNVNMDLTLSEASFPTFDYCNKPYIDALENNLKETGDAKFFTVKQPFAGVFEKGYFIIEPDEGQKSLLVDHQVSYPGTSIGNSRIQVEISPEFYTFLCDARTPAFRPKEETKKNFEIVKNKLIKDYPITTENVLFVDEDTIYNPRTKFDFNGINHEFMMHELIDIIAFLKFVDVKYSGKFVGRLTTFLFDHHKQIDAANFMCSDEMEKIGIVF